MRIPHGRHLLIPRGVYFGGRLFPEIIIPHNHATPYIDLTTTLEAPFMSVELFSTSDPLFMGVVRDHQLYMVQVVVSLKSTGAFNPPVEPDPCSHLHQGHQHPQSDPNL